MEKHLLMTKHMVEPPPLMKKLHGLFEVWHLDPNKDDTLSRL